MCYSNKRRPFVLVMSKLPHVEHSYSSYFNSAMEQATERRERCTERPLFTASLRVCYSRKADTKVFVLRSLSNHDLSSIDQLRSKIVKQLGDGIVPAGQPFDVGYMRGATKICIHSEEDLLEAWSKIEKESCMLWCDGTTEVVKGSSRTTKRALPLQSSSESNDEESVMSKKKKKKTSALQEKKFTD